MMVVFVPFALAGSIASGGAAPLFPMSSVIAVAAPGVIVGSEEQPVVFAAVGVVVPPELWPVDPYPPTDEAPESLRAPAPPPDPLPYPGPGQPPFEES